jgi:hypothetical protein
MALVNMAMNLRVPPEMKDFLPVKRLSALQEGLCSIEVVS